MLRRLHQLSQSDPAFEDVNIDHYNVFWMLSGLPS